MFVYISNTKNNIFFQKIDDKSLKGAYNKNIDN